MIEAIARSFKLQRGSFLDSAHFRSKPIFKRRDNMKSVLALAVFVLPVCAMAEESSRTAKPPKVPIICTKSDEQVSGLTKICYYTCAKSEGAITVATYQACPRWTTRWRLNRSGHFGPSANPRQ
jgi:hypothetical protein